MLTSEEEEMLTPVLVAPRRGYVDNVCIACCKPLGCATQAVVVCPGCAWPCCSTTCALLDAPFGHGLECGGRLIAPPPLLPPPPPPFTIGAVGQPATSKANAALDMLAVRVALAYFVNMTDPSPSWKAVQLQAFDNKQTVMPAQQRTRNIQQMVEHIINPNIAAHIDWQQAQQLYNYVCRHTVSLAPPAQGVALYRCMLGVAQSCTPTAQLHIDPVTLRASITEHCWAGQHLAAAQTTPSCNTDAPPTHSICASARLLDGTFARWQSMGRACTCARCLDPDECGTALSALRCLEPCGGYQLPDAASLLESVAPPAAGGATNTTAHHHHHTLSAIVWRCRKCGIQLPHKQVHHFVRHLEQQVDKVLMRQSTMSPPTVVQLDELLRKLAHFVQDEHYLCVRIKQALIGLLEAENADKLAEVDENRREVLQAEMDGVRDKILSFAI